MNISRVWRRAAVPAVVACLAAAPTAVASAPASTSPASVRPSALPEPPPVGRVRGELAALTVEAPHSMAGYSRAKFPHWALQYGTCDTREVVLQRDGTDVVQDADCRAVSGTWTSPYDGLVFTESGRLDIDHMVPLANAWRSGADTWDTPRRKAFANDLKNPQLVAVSAASNRSKGDQSPDQWSPPSRSYHCTYARAWTHVKSVYGLNITEAEKTRLGQMLDTCPA
ncbi:HNH endonuclease family protein [Embleya sp. AB8]|uniref:HNH endonuclease family protein n=1 Tax=Embleya sp. AB8 TaxID=3156304 RepID=UPI003C784948